MTPIQNTPPYITKPAFKSNRRPALKARCDKSCLAFSPGAVYNLFSLMPLVEVLLLAVGLSMDAFAVSVVAGLSMQRNCFAPALRRGLVFGTFQAGMPILGWLGGMSFRGILAPFDHWIAFGLLMLIGLHMILGPPQSPDSRSSRGARASRLLLLGFATSIDALAVGLTFALLEVKILTPVLIIGAITFFMSFGGVYLGQRVGRIFARRIDAVGGLILIAIGIRILLEHLLSGT